ncbi:hypothetical protein RJ641_007514 [Dillenia turbinata]|uniref:Uncharacterized protein n=1 Tax=Dillenia turbinata TaxID=194707 RepID=A0AAN8V1D0_9MAGN
MGSWKFHSGVINIASYPVLCIDYMELIFPALSSGFPRVLSILPFLVMNLIAMPKIEPRRSLSLVESGVSKDWVLFFNTLFWNSNFLDNASTLASELDEPQRAYLGRFFQLRFWHYWTEVDTVLSAIALFEAQLSSSAFQVLGMSDLGILPRVFGCRSKWFNTQLGILFRNAAGICFISLVVEENARVEETI